jgi:hypothetical protein
MTRSVSTENDKNGYDRNREAGLSHGSSQGFSTRRQFLGTSMISALAVYATKAWGVMKEFALTGVENNTNPDKQFEIAFHKMPSPERLAILDWIAGGKWCGRISTPPDVTDAMLEEVKKRGWPVTLTMWAHPETLIRQYKAWHRLVPDMDEVIARFKAHTLLRHRESIAF